MLKRNRKVTFRLNEGEWRQLKGHVRACEKISVNTDLL